MGGGGSSTGTYGTPMFSGGTSLKSKTPFAGRDEFGRYPAVQGNQLSDVYDQMFSGGTPLKQGAPDPRWLFPMKKPGVPNDPNTDWYGYSMAGLNASTQFPPPQNFFGQGTKML